MIIKFILLGIFFVLIFENFLYLSREKETSTRDEEESSTASFPFPFESLEFLNF